METVLLGFIRGLNELLTAGIAITAFSLLLYALSFNLHDRVARSFALILFCVVIVFVSEALSSVAGSPEQLEFWLRAQWLGIAFLPPAYYHLSDAILATTGRPSRGRRRLVIRLAYLVSLGFIAALPFSLLVGPLQQDSQGIGHLQRTALTWVFTAYYVLFMALSWANFVRAHRRTTASASRRRMTYLITGALAPALGSYPYLLLGPGVAANYPWFFWLAVTISNLFVSALLLLMAYGVAFFGVSWPDRVIKRRLFKWFMRGPATASTVLAVTTLVRRLGENFGLPYNALVPVFMVGMLLILEHLITLAAPIWERWLFGGGDRADMEFLQSLEDRLLTKGDLRQFLEAVLAAMGDRLQVSKGFLAGFGVQGLELFVTIGGETPSEQEDLSANLLEVVAQNGGIDDTLTWGEYWLVPLFDPEEGHEVGRETGHNVLLGLVGLPHSAAQSIKDGQDEELAGAFALLTERATLALRDRWRQQQAFSSLEALTPQIELIQSLRAAARYNRSDVLASPGQPLTDSNMIQWVKEALTHYWGGPKLTESPLLRLNIVRKAMGQNEDSPTNALRAVLRQAIEQTRPAGEKRLTADWILYNILEMKFMEGRKVREIAMRLAMSEADLYRKQRVALEAVARAITEMEQQVVLEQSNLIDSESIHPK